MEAVITKANAELTLMEARDAERQSRNLKTLHNQVNQYLSDYNAQKVMLIGLGVFLLVCVTAAAMIFRGYIIKAKLNEQLAKANGELEEKNEELKRLNEEVMELTHSRLVFFTNISHELRTPLTLIADPVEMMLEDSSIKGRSRELLKMVQRNALALQQLVGNILDFRKIQNGKMELSLSRFDIVEAKHILNHAVLLLFEDTLFSAYGHHGRDFLTADGGLLLPAREDMSDEL